MSSKYLVSVAASAAMMLSGPAWAGAERASKLPPVGPWYSEATESQCAVRRAFGDARDPLILEMARFAPTERFELRIGGKLVSTLSETISVQYGDLPSQGRTRFQKGWNTAPDRKPIGVAFATSSLAPQLFYEGLEKITPAEEASAKQISLQSGKHKYILESGSLAAPFSSLRQCTSALVSRWGLDNAVLSTLSRKPKPIDVVMWARELQKAYPVDQASRGQEGRVNVRLLIDKNGKPTDCKVVQSYSEPAFDKSACEKLLQYSSFEPALDASGEPVPSYFTTVVTWTLG